MKKTLLIIATCAALVGTATFPAEAKKKKPSTQPTTMPISTKTPEEIEAQYAASLDKRSTQIVLALNIDDTDKAKRVHDILVAQYRAIRDWHDANDPQRKPAATQPDLAAQLKSSLQVLHDHFITQLSAEISPAQIETVEDKLTVNKVQVTYNAYLQIVPNLTDTDKAKILDFLKQAREIAIDDRTMTDKSATFKVYKGKINNYLNASGHDVTKAYKDWGAAQKTKTAAQAPATEPVE